MFKTIYKHLKSKGFECYSVGQHTGICKTEYIVIKNSTPRALSKVMLEEKVELLLYYPIGRYSEMEEFISRVRIAMSELDYEDNYTPYPIIPEDGKDAYMTILSYKNVKERVI